MGRLKKRGPVCEEGDFEVIRWKKLRLRKMMLSLKMECLRRSRVLHLLGFAFNQLSEPLIFPELRSGARSTCRSSQKSISVLHLPPVFGLYIIGIQSEKHGIYILMIFLGHFSAHTPQFVHLSASICARKLLTVIAPASQFFSQRRQPIHPTWHTSISAFPFSLELH